jgi:quercetin dioxygenase-like cupin family protein
MKTTPPPAHEAVLDETLVARLAEAVAADAPLDAATQARIKRRVLQRIAADNTPSHLTCEPGEAGWRPFGDGVRIKVLHEAGGIMSYLLRLAPGASLPAHRHPVDEECVVLEGEVQIGSLRVAAGGFHLGRKGVLHDRLASAGGALIYLRGAVPAATLAL